jgi:transcriptional regulator with XRE-family HTH domain
MALPATTAPGPARRYYDHQKLRAWREAAGLSLKDVTRSVDVSYPWLIQLEGGTARAQPSVQLLTALAELYGHHPGELLIGAAA